VKALILAAGEGTRLRPLTLERPKPMLPIGRAPLLDHLVRLLARHGVSEIAINLHYKPDAVTTYFGDGSRWGVRLTYSHEERMLGTAGAVRRLQSFLDETFFVLYGDVLTDLDLTALAAFHVAKQAALTAALYRVPRPWDCGIVALDGSGRITRFVEKPPRHAVFSDLANAGVYVVQPEVIEEIPPDTCYDFGHDLFPVLLERGAALYGYPIGDNDYLLDIGSPDKYEQAQRDWAAGRIRLPDTDALRGETP
jgi:mannose-1-phosphate guanylyltransferase/phosphomannomutase